MSSTLRGPPPRTFAAAGVPSFAGPCRGWWIRGEVGRKACQPRAFNHKGKQCRARHDRSSAQCARWQRRGGECGAWPARARHSRPAHSPRRESILAQREGRQCQRRQPSRGRQPRPAQARCRQCPGRHAPCRPAEARCHQCPGRHAPQRLSTSALPPCGSPLSSVPRWALSRSAGGLSALSRSARRRSALSRSAGGLSGLPRCTCPSGRTAHSGTPAARGGSADPRTATRAPLLPASAVTGLAAPLGAACKTFHGIRTEQPGLQVHLPHH